MTGTYRVGSSRVMLREPRISLDRILNAARKMEFNMPLLSSSIENITFPRRHGILSNYSWVVSRKDIYRTYRTYLHTRVTSTIVQSHHQPCECCRRALIGSTGNPLLANVAFTTKIPRPRHVHQCTAQSAQQRCQS